MPKKITTTDFIQKAKEVHGDNYSYTSTVYTDSKSAVVYFCVNCNENVTQIAKSHLAGHGCAKCAENRRVNAIKTPYEDYIKIANKKHESFYIYSELNLEAFKYTKLTNLSLLVTCPTHGEFTVNAERHIKDTRLQGCQKCRIDKLVKEGKMPGGYCETLFKENSYLSSKKGVLYYLKIGELFKIGITTNLQNRIAALKTSSKLTVETLYTYETELGTAFKLEQAVLSNNSELRTSTNWSTELFTSCVMEYIKKEITDV